MQYTSLLGDLNDFFITEAVQIGLGNADIFMAQETADGIEIGSHLDLLLGEEVTAGMWADTDVLYPLSVAFYDMLNC